MAPYNSIWWAMQANPSAVKVFTTSLIEPAVGVPYPHLFADVTSTYGGLMYW